MVKGLFAQIRKAELLVQCMVSITIVIAVGCPEFNIGFRLILVPLGNIVFRKIVTVVLPAAEIDSMLLTLINRHVSP